MDETWNEAWLRSVEPFDGHPEATLARAEALLESGRLGEGLRALEEEELDVLAAAELHATWLVRLGSAHEARGVELVLKSTRPPDGHPTPFAQVRGAWMAQRAGDVDEALLRLERAASQLRAEGAPWGAWRVDVVAATMRLSRHRGADVEWVEGLCQSMPKGAVRDALSAWTGAHRGHGVQRLLELARALPQRVLGAELLAAGAILARDQDGRQAHVRAQELLLERVEELGLSLPPRLRAGLFEQLAPTATQRRARVSGAQPTPERERLARVFQTLTRLAREPELPRLLEKITDGAVDLTGAERGFVLLSSDGGPSTEVQRRAGATLDDVSDATFSRSIAQSVIRDARPIVTVDAQHDPRLHEFESVHQLALTSVACVPIRGRAGVLGALYLEHRVRRARFDADDLDLLLAFADQAAVALETHAALTALAAQRDELRAQRDELEATRAELEDALGRRGVELADTQRTLAKLRNPDQHGYEAFGIVGRSEALARALAKVDRVRDVDLPVVFRGESGTGKELFARALHASGARRAGPFVALGCGALSESLLESELFGHVRGAFTGAERAREGVFVRATGGTLFLDELEDMPAKMQVDLLRVLQERRVRPLGGDQDVPVDVRVIGATRRPLSECVAAGTFREDLFYRLQVVEIVVPSLRERLSDVPQLAAHILRRAASVREGSPRRLGPSALSRIIASGLPGNVRQLEHLLASASLLSDAPVLEASAFDGLLPPIEGVAAAALEVPTGGDPLHPASGTPPTVGESVPAPRPDPPPPQSEADWKALERERILLALESSGWNRGRAASELGMPRRTFYRRLKEHGIL